MKLEAAAACCDCKGKLRKGASVEPCCVSCARWRRFREKEIERLKEELAIARSDLKREESETQRLEHERNSFEGSQREVARSVVGRIYAELADDIEDDIEDGGDAHKLKWVHSVFARHLDTFKIEHPGQLRRKT